MALIDLQFDYLHMLFDILLKDKNTGKNIIWGTNDYIKRGIEYSAPYEITYDTLNDLGVELLQPRVTKSKAVQKGRTKDKAEVFTPSWICEYMNDFCEKDWIAKNKKKFNKELGMVYKEFLKSYIDVRKLEITCGEAPFVVSRYDTTTGELIPLYNRIGFLDKKLTAICQYIDNMDEWFEMVCRAFESCYGYEYQGDNLFKARINLVQTFLDYYDKKWVRGFPSNVQLRKIANIVSRNFWQMDGLTNTAPNTDIKCKVYNWRSKKNMDLIGEDNMKFDYIVGNPPYQDKTENRIADSAIYDVFMENSFEIGDKVLLITPGRFLFNVGNTSKAWNKKMLNDEHFKVLKYYANSKEVFGKDIDIPGGVVIHYRDKTKDFGKIELFVLFEELNSILRKVKPTLKNGSLDSIMYPQNKYNLDILFKDFPNIKQFIGSNGKEKRLVSSCFERKEIFHESKESSDDIIIQGIVNNNQRKRAWINKKYVDKHPNLEKYKVILPCSNGSHAIGENNKTVLIGEPFIGEPNIGYTQSFTGIGAFETIKEAENAMKYIKSKFCRVMLGVLKVTPSNTPDKWVFVPIQDFTENSDIDWSVSISDIDKQLYKKYGLDEKEIAFIEEKVKEME